MCSSAIPATVQTLFQLAGVVPVFVPGLAREAWLSRTATVEDGREVLLINADLSLERLEAIADQALMAQAAAIPREGLGHQE